MANILAPGSSAMPKTSYKDLVTTGWINKSQTASSGNADHRQYWQQCAPMSCSYDIYGPPEVQTAFINTVAFVGGAVTGLRLAMVLVFALLPYSWFGSPKEPVEIALDVDDETQLLQAKLAYEQSVGPYCLPITPASLLAAAQAAATEITLHVFLVSGRSLLSLDSLSESDPYVILAIMGGKTPGKSFKSKVNITIYFPRDNLNEIEYCVSWFFSPRV